MPNLSDRMLTLLGCHEVHTCKIPDVYLVYNVSKFSLAARSTSILTNTRITLLLVLQDYVRSQPPIEVVSCKSIHCSKLRKKFSTPFNFRRKGFFGCFQFKYWAGRFIKVQVLFEYDFRPPKRSELWYIPEYFRETNGLQTCLEWKVKRRKLWVVLKSKECQFTFICVFHQYSVVSRCIKIKRDKFDEILGDADKMS